MAILNSENIAIYKLSAPNAGVEFVIFGEPNDIEQATAVLAPSFEEDLVVQRLDAPRVPGYEGGYEGVLPEDEGPAPLCLKEGDEVAWFDNGRNYKGIVDGIDELDPTHVWVRDGNQRLRVRAVSIVCQM